MFRGQAVSSPLFLLCSLNWPCRSNSPRRWQPASCLARSPPQLRPSVPCQGPWPSGLPPPQPPPSSQLPSWAQLCSAPQREPSALPRDPSSLPPISPSRGARAAFPVVPFPTLLSPGRLPPFLHPTGDSFHSRGVPDQPRRAGLVGRAGALHSI